ncbi:MAG: hypothetical protein M1376_03140 [Planctomycetes bacterium]|nr:hypothetical protein [Planctomycetota bacterium]
MIGIRPTELTHPLVQSFSGTRSALQDVFQHYKMGRYGEAFPEKPYFLLSRCTHVLFSLWLAEQESERGFFDQASPPAAFSLGLDFGELRYSEYKRRMLHGDGLEEHLRHETKWFEFWLRILEQFDASNVPAYQKFRREILAWGQEPGFLEGKADRTHRKAFQAFMMSNEAGRVLIGTIRLLEDLLRAIVGCFTAPEAGTCVVEQMILLTGLLSEMRRILLWETPAQGPYLLSGRTRWHNPSPLQRLFHAQTPGLLTVVPKREGGEIVCTFEPVPDTAGRRSSWIRRMTSPADTYEAELFATWSYHSGAPQEHPRQIPDLPACWTVQNAEARRLETLSKWIDGLLHVLRRDPVCTHLARAVRRVARNDVPEWQAVALPWTHVNQLDQLIDKLTFVYREAKAAGSDEAAHNIIQRIWPSGKAATERADPGNRQDRRDRKCPRASASAPAAESAPRSPAQAAAGTLASLLQRLGGGHTDQKNSPAKTVIGASEPAGDSERPNSAEPARSPEPVAAVPGARSQQWSGPATSTANTDGPNEVDQILLRRLLEHHELPGGTINYEPLSSTELQQDLGWSLSKVQRALANIFGPKPTNAYHNKCRDRTICAFLNARAGGEKTCRTPGRAKPPKAKQAPGASAKAKARRQSRRRVAV